MKRIVVTGGEGFIGSNFIRYVLTNSNFSVLNIDLKTYAGRGDNLADIRENPILKGRYYSVHGNVGEKILMKRLIYPEDFIVHFAAESHVDRSILDPSPFIATNVVGTHVLLEAAVKAGVSRFHHISTDEVYGALPLESKEKFTEATRYDPRSPYSASKAGSDHFVMAYHYTFGLPVTITNCSNNFGPFQFPEKFIPLAITNILEGKKIPVYGDGQYVRDWLFVEDHCRAIDAVIVHGQVGETYCVGGLSQDIDNISVIKKIIQLMRAGESIIEFVKDRPGHDRRYAVDWSKIQRELDWKPVYDFDTWLEKTIAWYKTHENWWKSVKSGAYQQYYQQQYGGKK